MGPNPADESRVLIVDDDEEMRHVLRLVCDSQGLNVVGEASNGVEAVALALRELPNLVILDYMLPRLDEEGAAELLRVIIPDAKIVAFSAMLDSQPPWADAFLNKERIVEMAPLLQSFIR
jgi:CheY-like chemotaxis protein